MKVVSTRYLIIIPFLIIVFSIIIYPFLIALQLSFYNLHGHYTIDYPGKDFVGLMNYLKVLISPYLWNAIKITIIYVLGATVMEFLFGLGSSLLVFKVQKGQRIYPVLFTLPLVISPIVYGSIWRLGLNVEYGVIPYYLKSVLGLAIQPLGLDSALFTLIIVDVMQWFSFFFLVFYAALKSLPKEPFESAALDGASGWKTLRYITLPLLKPVMVVAILLRAISAFKTFDTIYILTGGGPIRSTTTISFYIYNVFFHEHNVGKACAATIILSMAIMVLYQVTAKIYYRYTRARIVK